MTTMAHINEPRCGRNHLQCPVLSGATSTEECRNCIVWAADYERDLKHEDGREWDESWLGKLREEEDRRRYD